MPAMRALTFETTREGGRERGREEEGKEGASEGRREEGGITCPAGGRGLRLFPTAPGADSGEAATPDAPAQI